MAWVYLTIAGLLEVCWALALKASVGFSKPLPTVIFAITILGSMALLALAMRHLPVGSAYAIWTGIGAVGTAIVGIVLLGESASVLRIVSLVLIVLGILGLKLSS
ncbi:MAG: quaternary ammonium compound efflux SMR transporter SugE [Plesiomonas sp.]|uniref:quaternary ammonium compound efflux SMR transporter SugE n=1 Tax=Plesiomonas sp. TaxID=2486279 RepID=UPI003F2BAE5A